MQFIDWNFVWKVALKMILTLLLGMLSVALCLSITMYVVYGDTSEIYAFFIILISEIIVFKFTNKIEVKYENRIK